jgi:hypothetical protein
MRVGITGHQRLQNPEDWEWVRQELNTLLRYLPQPLIGVTCLAIGADQLFADAVLLNGGELEAVIPFPEYAKNFEGAGKLEYQRLLNRSCRVTILQKKSSAEEAYFEAGKVVANSSDFIIGVWNGEAAAGLGGTADVIRYAMQKSKSVVHFNPIHHTVSHLQAKD